MNKLIQEAHKYMGANADQIDELFDYYNECCLPLVDPKLRHSMDLGEPWCALFVSVCAHKAGVLNFPFGVSVKYQVRAAKREGQYMPRYGDYTRGDLVVFDWVGGSDYDHIGLVEYVESSHIVTIEGNYSGTVKRRTIGRNSSAIAGFIRVGARQPMSHHQRIQALAKAVLQGDKGDGKERRRLLGADYWEVQGLVNKILGQ